MAISIRQRDDLQHYLTDIAAISPLSAQEEEHLLSLLRLARHGLLSPEQGLQAKDRLLEGYLPRVIGIAEHQSRLFHHFSLLDLIQEGNLGLLQVVEDYDFAEMNGCFFAYATACIRNAIIRALPRDGLMHVPRCEFWHLAGQGKLKDLDRSQPFSLDSPITHQERSLYEVLP